jgi:hypothetical protein
MRRTIVLFSSGFIIFGVDQLGMKLPQANAAYAE